MNFLDFLKKNLKTLSRGSVASIVVAIICLNYTLALLTFLLEKEIYVNPDYFDKKAFLFVSNKHMITIGFTIIFLIIDTLLGKIYQ